eukprot:SAG31_NODE_2235_length_6123_cov_2.723274_7_plen_147_part_00
MFTSPDANAAPDTTIRVRGGRVLQRALLAQAEHAAADRQDTNDLRQQLEGAKRQQAEWQRMSEQEIERWRERADQAKNQSARLQQENSTLRGDKTLHLEEIRFARETVPYHPQSDNHLEASAAVAVAALSRIALVVAQFAAHSKRR